MSGQPSTPDTQVLDTDGTQADASTCCAKCCAPIHDLSQAFHKGNGIYQCSNCHNIYQMLYRHLGSISDTVARWPAHMQKKFFKETSSKLKIVPVNGRWSLVKSQLVSHHTSFRKEQRITRVSEIFKPLSVWKLEGYDTDLIQQKGQKSTNPVAWLHVQKKYHMIPSWKHKGHSLVNPLLICMFTISFTLLCMFKT